MNINAALGMVERPLQVGDWVELLPSGRGMAYLDFATWPKQIIAVENDGFVRFDEINNGPWNCNRFRRVDPPRERDEVAELREQLNKVTRQKNEAVASIHSLVSARNVLREQLTTAQSEAAAMREALQVGFMTGESNSPEFGRYRVVIAFRDIHSMQRCYSTLLDAQRNTAGRELLDEMADLRKRLASISEMHHDLDRENARLERKARNAKRAYVATLRGKIDPAWLGEQVPVWKYRERGQHFAVWRTADCESIETYNHYMKLWQPSVEFKTWQACCDDPDTYPCDEHGERLSDGGAK